VKRTITRLGLLCALALAQGCNHRSHDVSEDGDAGGSSDGYNEETPDDGPSSTSDAGGSEPMDPGTRPTVSNEESHLEGPSAAATVSKSERFTMVSRVGVPSNPPLEAKGEHFSIKSSLFSVRGKK
jgi:hypothetical protein